MSKNKTLKTYLFTFTPIIIIIALTWTSIGYLPNHETFAHDDDNYEAFTLASTWDASKINYEGNKQITVYRSPACGCCGGWIQHMQKHGFQITDIKTDDMDAIKAKYNIPAELASCHTSIIDDYVIEGHIPADDIKRFLTDKPNVAGLTVPGMPIGTPGMESGHIKQPFTVLTFNNQGETKVFNSYQKY